MSKTDFVNRASNNDFLEENNSVLRTGRNVPCYEDLSLTLVPTNCLHEEDELVVFAVVIFYFSRLLHQIDFVENL